jgi:signal recognition particle receptor subunit beta
VVVVSYSGKEINAKLVYYGCGLSGKTTNLESIYEAVPDTSRGKMVSMKTQSDRTLFFDLLPLDLGEIMGFKTRFLLYTVPGQVFYNATRKLVLKGADAIVFVADSEVGKMEENKDSLANLKTNLSEYGLSLDNIPWVIQYNKRDLANVYTLEELNAELNPAGKIPFFEAVAKDGKGVFETFRGISHLLMEKVTKDLRRGSGAGSARPADPVPEPKQEPARATRPATAPAHAIAREAQETAGVAGQSAVDYGREIELPGDATRAPRATAPVTAAAPPARQAPPGPAAVPKPVEAPAVRAAEPAPVASAPAHAPRPRMPEPAAVSAGPAPGARADASAGMGPASHDFTGARGSAAPAAPPRVAASPRMETARVAPSSDAPGLAPRVGSEELIVPIKLGAPGTHEIVLRIVLRLEG